MKSLPSNLKISVIIAAAGKGERAGFEKNKLLVPFENCTPLFKTVKAFELDYIDEIVISSNENEISEIKELLKDIVKAVEFAKGGKTRFDSVKAALEIVTGDIVLIHDGARPYVTKEIIENCIESVINYGSGICAVCSTDTLCQTENGEINAFSDRDKTFRVQTPQGFYTEDIKKAYRQAEGNFTDDSSVYLKYIGKPKMFYGDSGNIKLTFKKDFSGMNYYTGIGFDTHRLVTGRKMILGGVEIESELGLLGHSDADVLTHAIMDALLSSAGLRDIGFHFSDSDDTYKDISSMLLLTEVMKMLSEKEYKIKNVSAVIIAEKPKLSPYIDIIKENLAKVMHISTECVGITATTNEKMGYLGRSEGVSVTASVLTYK